MKMTADEVNGFFAEVFPQAAGRYVVTDIGPMTGTLRYLPGEADGRPGGAVSGPTLFSVADIGFYAAVLGQIGPVPLAVTVNASIDFMRMAPSGRAVTGTARILKLGRRLAVGDVTLFSEGLAEPVARASLTFSVPPR